MKFNQSSGSVALAINSKSFIMRPMPMYWCA